MKFAMKTIQNTKRLIRQSRRSLAGQLAGLALCMVGFSAHAADITVDGLGDIVKGDVRAQVLVDEPVTQVQMKIAGVVNRIERSAPFGLMSDRNGELNPWDTSAHANGEYILTVIATLEDGEEVTEHFPFKIENAFAKAKSDKVSVGVGKLPSQVYAGQQFTIPTAGLADGEIVWLHTFDKGWGDLTRNNLRVKGDRVTLTIPDKPGVRRVQLQYKSEFKKTRLIEVLPAMKLPEPEPAPAPATAPETTPEPEATPEPEVAPKPEATPEPVATPEPAPAPAPTPSPEPAPAPEVQDVTPDVAPAAEPELVKPAIDASGVSADLTVGQRLVVPVKGIDDGEVVFLHLFNRQWGDLIRRNLTVSDGQVQFTVPEASGKRILQLQYKNLAKVNKWVSVDNAQPEPEILPEVPVVVPEPEVVPEVVPAPEVLPEPETVQASIDLSVVPAGLTIGQRISVPVKGIADGQKVFFHLFNDQWGDLVRKNVAVSNGKIEIVIPNAGGARILQLQYGNEAKASKRVFVASATASSDNNTVDANAGTTGDGTSSTDTNPDTSSESTDGNPDTTTVEPQVTDVPATDQGTPADPTNDTTPAIPGSVPTLVPGSGWKSATSEPGPVGSATHPGHGLRAISRWAVVPHQTFRGEFAIGVAAFHAYEIDRVAFSVDNGPWVSVREMTTNPRTRTDEYFVKLNASNFTDGKVVVRAIAYPKYGQPRLLEDLELFANKGGSVKFPVLELGPGQHHLTNLSDLTPKSEGWLTVRPKAGVAKEDVVITKIDRIAGGGNIKIQGVTMKHGGGNNFLAGKATGTGWAWLDDVKVIGNGRSYATSWLAHLWARQYYTDCEITKVRNVFHGGGGGLFARNIEIYDIYEDIFRNHGYVANVTVDGVDRGETSFHPDLFDFASSWKQANVIYQDVTIRRAYSLGMAGSHMQDIAMINCDIETPGWTALEIGGELNNVLFKNSRFMGGSRLRNAEPDGVVIRDSSLGWRAPFLPEGWQDTGVTVLPRPPLYD